MCVRVHSIVDPVTKWPFVRDVSSIWPIVHVAGSLPGMREKNSNECLPFLHVLLHSAHPQQRTNFSAHNTL